LGRTEQGRTANSPELSVKAAQTMKYREITADNLSKAGWSLGWVKDQLRHLIAVVWP
jgi:hypothetical protein